LDLSAILFNAQARDYGAELYDTVSLTPTLTGSLSLAYLHTKVMGVDLPDGTVMNNAQAPNSPRLSVAADLRKEWREPFGNLFAEATVSYVGSRYFSTVNEPCVQAPSYATGNARVGYTTANRKWTWALSMNNINNKAYQVYLYDEASVAGSGQQNFAPPRWVRGEVEYKF